MPEGDTIFRTARELTAALVGKPLLRGEIRHPRLSTVDLAGRTVIEVRPVGKHLFLRFDGGRSLHCHLELDGAWHVYRPRARWRRPAHQARAILSTGDKTAVGFALHELAWLSTVDEHRLVGHLGPDLLDPRWTDEHARRAAENLAADPDAEIGIALLDQRVLAGLGNVYKTEVCFLLGVSPWTPVSGVDTAEAVRIGRELLRRNASRAARSTTGYDVRDRRLWVYARERAGCLRCGGRVVRTSQGERLRERVAYYCPTCQPGPTPVR
ncbi:endonuclease-8 [Herbihabitans rhizosphaerae]|uniref:DNA-(apurinic or apyrimidinic site) lyase n=1 Tax=Herbihabitans rhizosphaerae TaxID=1872711 RepID=A0A4Q7KHZ4_9PSEU|nr:DNA-formamidopyrimidine glycosylase family protein [Herbihabitans rhizosphaerae]RZS34779.1 endonuclease-8 [Herbihabitans rhizosphaerae]